MSARHTNGKGPGRKPRFAMYWAASCGGCDIAVLNLDEALLDVGNTFDIVFWPAVMDAKYADVEAMEDASIDVTLFSGGIRNEENEHLARLLRAKSRLLIAIGSCAAEGCIPGLANLGTMAELFETVYTGVSTQNVEHVLPTAIWQAPEGELRLPGMSPRLRTLAQVVPVDYVVPGCPPESAQVADVVGLLLAAFERGIPLPPAGSVLGAGRSTVCDECRRDRHLKRISAFRRIQELPSLDPDLCLLEQGLPCNGPATRSGCGALCPAVAAACIGCYGPADGVVDYGARLMSAFASVVDAEEPDEIERILDGIPDPVGQFYRFSLAGSLLGGRRAGSEREPSVEVRAEAQPQHATAGGSDRGAPK